jgi:hypothetical protein
MAELRAAEQIRQVLDIRNRDVVNNLALSTKNDATATLNESGLMVEVARQTRSDSRTMKIASIIAVAFLPANLVSVRSPLLFFFVGVDGLVRRGQ